MNLQFLNSTITYIVVIYVGIWSYAHFYSDKAIFLPTKAEPTENFITLKTKHDLEFGATYMPVKNSKYVILISHGNAETINVMSVSYAPFFNNLNLSVFAYDYIGYGAVKTNAKPNEKNTYDTIQASYNYLINNLNIKPENIILFGRSLGAGASIELALHNKVGGIILENPFKSAYTVVTYIPIFLGDKFKNKAKINNMQGSPPVLVVSSKYDKVIPKFHHKAVYKHYQGPKQLLAIKAGHNNTLDDNEVVTNYSNGVKNWVQEYVK